MQLWVANEHPTEFDLWFPALMVRHEQGRDLRVAALLVEAWMQWAETLGRRDALAYAASFAISLVPSGEQLETISRTWVQLPSRGLSQRSHARLTVSHADVLFDLGRNEEALQAYRTARTLFANAADLIGQGNSWLGEGRVRFRLNEKQEALQAYQKARSFFSARDDKFSLGHTWLGEATLLARMYQYDDALRAYREARALFAAVGATLDEGHTWNGEAEVHYIRGDNQEAIEAYRAARKLFRSGGAKRNQGITWIGEAEVLFRIGESKEALHAYRSARALFQVDGTKLNEANAWLGEGKILHLSGESEAALDAYRRARSLYESIGDELGQGNAWQDEARILFMLGRNEEARRASLRARVLLERAGEKIGQGNVWQEEARVLHRLGEREKALQAYKNARALFEDAGEKGGLGNTWSGEAGILFSLGKREQALRAYRTARTFFEAVGDKIGQGNTWNAEADVLFQSDDVDQALQAYRTARSLFEASGNQLGIGDTWNGEARVSLRRGDYQGTVRFAAAALKHFDEVSSFAVQSRINALLLLAQAEIRSGQVEAAATHSEEAIGLHDRWRTHLITDLHRTELDESIYIAYRLLILIRVRQPGRLQDALTYAEQARSRVLLDLLATPRTGVSPPELLATRRRLQAELAHTEEELAQAPDPRQRQELHEQRGRLDHALLWNRYEQVALQDRTLLADQPLDANAIYRVARENGPILLYYVNESEIVAFLVLADRAEPVVELLDVPRDRLEGEIQALRFDLANPLYESRSVVRARALWRWLIAPFTDHLPAESSLTIVAHGPLHELPFGALLDRSGIPLFERWDLSIVPSVSTLAQCRRRHSPPHRDDALLTFSAGQGLGLTQNESTAIARFFARVQSVNTRYRAYEEEVSKARHLFVATRGVHEQGSRTGTYLELLASETHDSRLSAAEIATIPIEAELVTLAACDTAAGQALLSDERLDLTRAFFIAGAASVLATRWKVPEDDRTSRFLVDFYRAYRTGGLGGKGLRKDEALTVARRLSRERGDPAQVWAAWVLVGDPR